MIYVICIFVEAYFNKERAVLGACPGNLLIFSLDSKKEE